MKRVKKTKSHWMTGISFPVFWTCSLDGVFFHRLIPKVYMKGKMMWV